MQYVYAVVSFICGVSLIFLKGWFTVEDRSAQVYSEYFRKYVGMLNYRTVVNWDIIVLGIMIVMQGFMVMAFYNMMEKKLKTN